MDTTSTRTSPAEGFKDGLPNPERLLAFLAIAIALTMAVLDSAIVNVALPVMARELQVDPATTVWASAGWAVNTANVSTNALRRMNPPTLHRSSTRCAGPGTPPRRG